MNTNRARPRIIPAILLAAACSASAFALKPGDGVAVEFKDGSRMTGVLVKQGRKKLRLDLGGAQMSFGLETVKSVKPKNNNVKKFQDMVKAAGDDRVKLLAAAEFARASGLDSCYDQLVARLGVPNQREIDDAAENDVLVKRAQDAADAKALSDAQIAEQKRLQREARRESERETRKETDGQ
jgi:hypothetical protein